MSLETLVVLGLIFGVGALLWQAVSPRPRNWATTSRRRGRWGGRRLGRYDRDAACSAAGQEGEQRVAEVIASLGLPALHDVYIPTDGGEHTQIDHLVNLGNRIAVIETKNWSDSKGPVTGHPDDERWCRGGESFGNPIRQNAFHIRMLKRMVRKTWLDNVVVFTGSAEPPPAARGQVVTLGDLPALLRPGTPHPAVDAMWERLEEMEFDQDKGAIAAAHVARLKAGRSGAAWH